MIATYPPYSLPPVRLRRQLDAHQGHTLTVMRTEEGGTLIHCFTCEDDVVHIHPQPKSQEGYVRPIL